MDKNYVEHIILSLTELPGEITLGTKLSIKLGFFTVDLRSKYLTAKYLIGDY